MSTQNPQPRRALVVIDVQNEYFSGNLPIEYPPVHDSIVQIGRAMDAAHAAGVPVVIVQHSEPAQAPVFAQGSHGWELHEAVSSRPRDHHVFKRWPSAFTGTGLGEWLAGQGIDTLAIAGYMTHNCDAATIFEAAHAGLKVEFLADASGSLPYANAAGRATAEEIHRVFSVVFHSRFAAVVDTQTWIGQLASSTAAAHDNPLSSNLRAREGSAHAA